MVFSGDVHLQRRVDLGVQDLAIVSTYPDTGLQVPYIRLRADEDNTTASPSSKGINVLLAEGEVVRNAIDLCDNYGHMAALQIAVCSISTEVVDIRTSGNIGNDNVLLKDR